MKNCVRSFLKIQVVAFLIGGFIADGLIAGGQDGGSVESSPDSMTYLGHASVKIRMADGVVIYIDPYAGNNYNDSADIVLITHEHSDHNVLSLVKRKTTCRVIRSADALVGGVYQTFSIGAVSITAVPAYNANHPKSSCVGYVLEFDGTKLYHAGDTGEIPEMADLAGLHLTYALLPMDGIYTMTPEQATSAAAVIGAEYSIPIHTMPPPDTYSDAYVARFTDPHKLVVHPGETIALVQGTTAIRGAAGVPSSIELCQNYPNPFNPTTTMNFTVPRTEPITLKIYAVSGAEVETIFSGTVPAGMHSIRWDATKYANGVYFCTLRAGEITRTKKLLLLK